MHLAQVARRHTAAFCILSRYLNLADGEAVRAYQTNSPADRHQQQRQVYARRLPLRRPVPLVP